MKMIIIIMTICLVQVSAAGLAQKVTLNEKETPLQNIIQKIRLQTGYDFIIDAKLLDKAKKVTINVNNAGLEDALDAIFKNQQLSYSITDKVVAIEPKEPTFLERLAERWADRDVRGRVVDEQGNPMPNASIRVKGKDAVINTNDKGEFVLKGVADDAVLVISYVGYKQLELPLKGAVMPLEIKLNQLTGQLEEVAVKGNTGYQVIDKKHPGSFDVVDNELLNRRVSTNILDRIENLTPGVLFDKTPGAPDPLLVRDRNSLFSNVAPLIVLDNFPYDGDIKNINPNDVENITILKDAAAAAQWGARAGNGVIIITTKKGRTSKPLINFNSSVTVQNRPNLFSIPIISSADAVDLERELFDRGLYDGDINNTITNPPLSPVQEILLKKREGKISGQQADEILESFKRNDVRTDLEKYFYRKGMNLQNAFNVSGSNQNLDYYLSTGWDRNYSNIVGQRSNRITINSKNTFKISPRFTIDAGVIYTMATSSQGNNPGMGIQTGKGLYPYADLVDDEGNGLRIVRDHNIRYIDTVGAGKLLDWTYNPFNDINEKQDLSKARDFLLSTGLRYKINNSLNIEAIYRFQNLLNTSNSLHGVNSYFARTLINKFYQPNGTNQFPIPIGGIMFDNANENISHQGRTQLNYSQTWSEKHKINAIAGWEIKDLITKTNNNQIYGYNQNGSSTVPSMDFVTLFPQYDLPGYALNIQNFEGFSNSLDRFISYYLNTNYSFDNRYTVSLSGREDAANLFGVKTNQKGVPLWSAGLSWELSNENFYKSNFLPYIRFRASYGSSGNFSRAASANTVMTTLTDEDGITYGIIKNPPNEQLRWEQVSTFNLGLDFQLINNRLSGSFEYFRKQNKDLMAQAPIDPTTGVTTGISTANTFFGNVASLKGNGYEVNLNSTNVNGAFSWKTNFILSHSILKVSKYLLPVPTSANSYLSEFSINPIIGNPAYVMYSYKWGGLDPDNGDPLGYIGGNISKNYDRIVNVKPDSLVFHGSAKPTYFGALRNSFSFRNLSLSIGISYKLDYYIRKRGINYNTLYSSWTGHSDYAQRWKNPGDEKFTNVPSSVFPDFSSRGYFYEFSEAMVLKGDHIRLDDVTLNYSINNKKIYRGIFKDVNIYSYITNLNAIIWMAEKNGVDPYLNGNPATGISVSIGLRAKF